MKNLLTTLFLLIPFFVLGQGKIDTIKYKAFNWEYMPPSTSTSDGRMIEIYRTPRPDTIKVWYHEVKELAGWVVERWTQGYKVVHSDYTILNSLDNADYYLEDDRKTRVKSMVLYSIPRN